MPYKFGCYTFLRFREGVFPVASLWLQSFSNFQVLTFLQKYLERLDRFFQNVHHECFIIYTRFYTKVSLTLMHWNIFNFNDKEDCDPTEKFAQRIHCWQVMQICSDQCKKHSSVINWQIFHTFDLHTFWKILIQNVWNILKFYFKSNIQNFFFSCTFHLLCTIV